ncbi:MAG: glutamate--tRNA ligase family protein [Firmicutes bacterium]|nr:glutamate--tRNA ligase family protein [Bacillota bacterium]
MNYNELANLLFPNITKTPEDYYKKYPPRKTPALRFAPSPTGFLHIGSLGTTLAGRMLADKLGGVFYLRIEDTDQKREIEGAVETLIKDFANFGIKFDEGFDGKQDFGKYGAYVQSKRLEIYHTFAKRLVELGRAYPCFCTPEYLDQIRQDQTAKKIDPGYRAEWLKCRNLSLNQIKENIQNKISYVLRFDPQITPDKDGNTPRITWKDLIKGDMSLPAQENHVVILKSDGIPPYNFAHIVDDTLMRTSHVTRSEEWLPSTAEHIQIARAFSCPEIFKGSSSLSLTAFPEMKETFNTSGPSKKNLLQENTACPFSAKDSRRKDFWYAHLPTISIMDGDSKRKLSKRKDKEALASHFIDQGYPVEAIIEYLLSIYNTDFEMWRLTNPTIPYIDFNFRFEKIGKNSPLFDLAKLNHISKEIISKKTKHQIKQEVTEYLTSFNGITRHIPLNKEDKKELLKSPSYTEIDKVVALLNIDRETEKPRKDISKFSDIFSEYTYVFEKPSEENFSSEEKTLLTNYLTTYKHISTREEWFAHLKSFNNKSLMKLVRRSITGKETGPDLYQIMQILGHTEVTTRLKH